MAKGKYEAWLEPENLVLLHGWKLQGLTDEQIADKIGIAHRTFERWKAEHSQIRQAIKGGKEVANFVIENGLYKKAKSGNVTAMIFWLKNNYPEKYSDSQKTKTDEELSQAQVERAKIETKIAQAKLDMISDADDAQMLAIDDLFKKIADDVGSDEDGTK